MRKKWIPILLAVIISVFIAIPGAFAGRPFSSSIKQIRKAVQTNIRQAIKPSFTIRSRYAGAMSSVAFSQDRKLFATGSANGAAQIWNLTTGQRDIDLRGHTGAVLSVAFIPGTVFLATGSKDGTAVLWNIETGMKIREFRGHSGAVFSLAPTPDGKFLGTAADAGTVFLWNVETGSAVQNFTGHTGSVRAIAISRDGKKLVSGGEDGLLRVWDPQTGTAVFTLNTKEKEVCSVAVSEDSKYLGVGLNNGTVQIWDFVNGQKVFAEEKHEAAVRSVSISPNGTFFASASADGTACLLSIPDGKELQRFIGHQKGLNAISFTPDGRYLLTAGDDLTARLWERDSGKETARLISMRSGWAVVSPEGHFDGTLDGEMEDRLDAVSWTVNEHSFPVDAFLEKYYRPALMGRLMLEKMPEEAEKVPDISEGFYLPPAVRISAPQQDAMLRDQTVRVTVEAEDQGGGIDDIRLFHNGKILDDTKAERIADQEKQQIKSYPAVLVDGKNSFRAVGFSSDRIESEPFEITVSYKAPDPPPPVLHVIAVGINKYKDPRLDLNFGVPDARGVLEYFTISYFGLFDKLVHRTLFDHDATQSSIYSMLESLQKIPPQDTVVIYFAGHGETIRDKWYYIPYDLTEIEKDESIEEKGVSSQLLQLYIARIGAQKIFLMMDACKSGAALDVFSEYEEHRPFALLSRSTGIHIAAAAAREQIAGELAELGHGVFTYTLLEALAGKADLNPADGNISVQETLNYIQEQMPILIKKHGIPSQKPVVNSRGMDFFVTAARK
jgi:WD40 repeat protein